MSFSNLISSTQLFQHLHHRPWVIIDCRFNLADSQAGATAYRHGHIPGAHYLHLDNDLSSAVKHYTGRHPLPDFKILAKKLGTLGVSNTHQVIAYDDANGAFAARLWWLLRVMGHEDVAVLDGGIPHWQQHDFEITTSLPKPAPCTFRVYLDDQQWLSALQLENALATQAITLLDARTEERYQGRVEPIDPVAGHIPKAVNRPFQHNLQTSGLFKPAAQLADEFGDVVGSTDGQNVVHMCGSGVTACHNLLAMDVAGLGGSRLYAGSWSDWIGDKNRAVATA